MHKLADNYYNHTEHGGNFRILVDDFNPMHVELWVDAAETYCPVDLPQETESRWLKLIDQVDKDEALGKKGAIHQHVLPEPPNEIKLVANKTEAIDSHKTKVLDHIANYELRIKAEVK